MTLRIGMVVGETSGDKLGASLIHALKEKGHQVIFEGVLGPALIEAGGRSLFPMDRLSIMGLVEPLKRLPELLKIRQTLIEHFKKDPPDVFIGIDSPDFNLRLEKHLKSFGIKVVHYVSPSVWAWRQSRINTIKKAVDLMLTLFPFECPIYEQHQVSVLCVGHPLADQIPMEYEEDQARSDLGYTSEWIVAILPGSRWSELKRMTPIYLKTAKICYERDPNARFCVPLVSQEHERYFLEEVKKHAPELPIKTFVNALGSVLKACHVALVTSGTATLEVLLYHKPMVVAYKTDSFTYFLAKRLVKVPYIALPNLLANERLVPEYIQEQVDPQKLALDLLAFQDFKHREVLMSRFQAIHRALKKEASYQAAEAVVKLLGDTGFNFV